MKLSLALVRRLKRYKEYTPSQNLLVKIRNNCNENLKLYSFLYSLVNFAFFLLLSHYFIVSCKGKKKENVQEKCERNAAKY